MSETKLFIPLKKQWYLAFECGEKDTEYRAYGPRWNERTCRPGRKATLSCGYSGARLERTITTFHKLPHHRAPAEARVIFPDAEFIAAIRLGAVSQHSEAGDAE